MKKINMILIMLCFFAFIGFSSISADAATLKTGKNKINFQVTNSSAVGYQFNFRPKKAFKGGDRIKLTIIGVSKGKRIYNKSVSLKLPSKVTEKDRDYKDYYIWWSSTEFLQQGNYTITLSSKKHKLKNYRIRYQKNSNGSNNYTESTAVDDFIMNVNGSELIKFKNVKPTGSWVCIKDIQNSNPKVAEVNYNGFDLWANGLKTGKTTVTLTLENNNKIKFMIRIYRPLIEYKNYILYKGEKMKADYYNYDGDVKWTSSNPKIAKISKNGTIKALKTGKCKITLKAGKYRATSTVKVINRDPNFGAYLYDYSTRGNYFVVYFKNWGNRAVTIYSNGSKAIDDDYKSFDRNLYIPGHKTVKIKPHKGKRIRFKVKGRLTWYNYEDFTICYNFRYDGVKRKAKTWFEESIYKKGNSWYGTYWSSYEDRYNDWIE